MKILIYSQLKETTDMKINELLQSETWNARISINGDRWLCGNEKGGYIVYEHKYRAKDTTIIVETNNEDYAVAVLLDE